MNRILSGVCASFLLAAPAVAQMSMVGNVADTINGTQAFDATTTTLSPTTVQTNGLPAVVITETEFYYSAPMMNLNPVVTNELQIMDGNNQSDTVEMRPLPDYVEYTVTNNMIGWDIIGFAVTNNSEFATTYADRSKDCLSVRPSDDCWLAERYTSFELDLSRDNIIAELNRNVPDQAFNDFLESLLAEIEIYRALVAASDDLAIHTYTFLEGLEIDDTGEEGSMAMTVSFAEEIAQATPIFAGTTQSGFFFDHGFAESNIAALAVNQQGQFTVISNINLAPVPVPAAGLLLIGGLAGLGLMRRKA